MKTSPLCIDIFKNSEIGHLDELRQNLIRAKPCRALLFNTTGTENTANGTAALEQNNGSNNTATGAFALFSNTASYENTAMRVKASPLFELAFVLVRFDHVSGFIVNANHGTV